MKEADLSKKIVKRIKARGGFAVKIHGTGQQKRGLPDVMGTYRKHALGIEVKLPGRENTVTELQAKVLADMREAGTVAFVATTVKKVDDILDAIDRLYDK